MKAIKYITIGLAAFFAGRYLLSLQRARNKVVITVTGQREKITAQGINIRLKYNIKNPTRTNMKMTAPLIKLSSNGKVLASSTMQQVEIPQAVKHQSGKIMIEAFKETGEITTKILVPWLSVLSVSSQLLARLQSEDPTEKVKVDIESTSQVFTALGDYPLDNKTTIEL